MKKSDAVEHFTSQSKLAAALGIAQSSVCGWGDIIPEKQALRLERITDGALKYEPELYGHVGDTAA